MKISLLLMLLLGLESAAGEGGSQSLIPAMIKTSREYGSSWVSAAAATSPDGSVNWSALDPFARHGFENALGEPRWVTRELFESEEWPWDRGTVVDTLGSDGRPETWVYRGTGSNDSREEDSFSTLEKAFQASWLGFRGEVLAVEPGFYGGDLGSLIAVRPLEVWKGGELPSVVLAYFPECDFRIGSMRFIRKNPHFPRLPKVGAEVVLMTNRFPTIKTAEPLLLPAEGIMVRQDEEPEAKQGPGRSRSFDSLVAGLRELSLDGANP